MKKIFRASSDTLRDRLSRAISGGYENADTLHSIYADFGYAETLSFANFWNLYRRMGLAKNVIELPVNVCWMSRPALQTDNEQFKREVDALTRRTRLWTRLKGLDTRQRVGRYAGLFVRVRDGLPPSQPLNPNLPGQAAIESLTPLYEGQLTVLQVDNDPMSASYGLPTLYQYNGGAAGNRNEKEQSSFNIHPSRLIMAAEGADDGGIYGVPALEACYNSLLDIRKIIGAGGEGFYRNAAQSVVFNLEDTSSANINTELLEQFNDKFDEFTKDRFRRGLWTPGLRPQVLEAVLPDPANFFQNALQDVAAACGIPSTILIGEQTGRLASNEDSRSFLSSMNSRRENFLTDLVINVIDWLISNGALPDADYQVAWPDLMALSTREKLDNARELSNICREAYQSGMVPPFTEEEIREASGREGTLPHENELDEYLKDDPDPADIVSDDNSDVNQ